jgi:membrane protein implicated in regulation of membrane protease activity
MGTGIDMVGLMAFLGLTYAVITSTISLVATLWLLRPLVKAKIDKD